MNNLEKATRHILQALHPECETWEDIEEKYSVCEYDESESLRISEKEKDEYFERNKFFLKPSIHLAEVLQAISVHYGDLLSCYAVKDKVTIVTNTIGEFIDWENATQAPLHKQSEDVWIAINNIFES